MSGWIGLETFFLWEGVTVEKNLSANNKINPQIFGVDADIIGNLSNDDDYSGGNVAKKMNLRSVKLNRVYLDPLIMLNAGDFSWSQIL